MIYMTIEIYNGTVAGEVSNQQAIKDSHRNEFHSFHKLHMG